MRLLYTFSFGLTWSGVWKTRAHFKFYLFAILINSNFRLCNSHHSTHNYWKNLISGYIWHFTIYISCYAFLLLINYYIVSLFLFFCLFHLLKKKIIQSNSLLKNWHRLYTFFLSIIYVHEVIIHDYVSFMNHDEDIRYVMSNELW